MTHDIKQALSNARDTFVSDAIGAVALVVLMGAALFVPSLF